MILYYSWHWPSLLRRFSSTRLVFYGRDARPLRSTPTRFSSRCLQHGAQCTQTSEPIPNGLDNNHEATVYVHWPFCKKLCTFCNFNKYKRDNVDHARMRECLVTECSTLLKLSGAKKIKSVYFGGGTPSLAEPATLSAVLECIRKECHLQSDAEITMEANPTSTESQKLREFKGVGINRLSLGIQTLNDRDLSLLGRQGSSTDLMKSIEIAKDLFPGRLSIDLLFGRPNQTLQEWEEELKQIVRLCDRHVSLYQLTLHRGTPLHRQVSAGELTLPSDDVMADLYTKAVDVLQEAGFKRYEVSNFAKPGSESQHNMSYWKGDSYIGVGPGAHGRFYQFSKENKTCPKRYARVQTLEPNAWMSEVEQFGHATRLVVPQTNTEILEEIIMLGLRTAEGVPVGRLQEFAQAQCSTLLDIFSSSPDVRDFIAAGIVELDEMGMRVTPDGIPVVDSITPAVVLHLENHFKPRHPCIE